MTGQQLKNSILQMAVQGKLVPQDPNDEPASVLLERIRAEKEQLIREGKIKREKKPSVIFRGADNLPYEKIGDQEPVCIADEVPFEIPESWEWVRLSSLGEIVGGGTPKTSESENWANATIPWLTPADMKFVTGKYVSHGERNISEYGLAHSSAQLMPRGSILYSSRAPIGYIAIAENDISTNQGFKSLVPITTELNDYLYYCLIALTPSIQARASGTTFKEISGMEFGKTLIPIPPLAEQRCIVTKIEEVMPRVAQYKKKENSLTQLNGDFPNQLKKSILQWAVQGKLVPQEPNDEPASVLLERIRAEKERLIREGKIKRDKHESVIFRRDNSYYEVSGKTETCINDEIPFEIPETWEWVRLSDLLRKASTGPFGSMLHKADYANIGTPLINPADIKDGKIVADKVKRVDDSTVVRLRSYCLSAGDVIIGRRGELGRSAVINQEHIGWLCGTGCFFVTPFDAICPEYLVFLLTSPFIRQILAESSVGTTMNNLNHDILARLLIPLPPLDEQKRIMHRYSMCVGYLND